ncbi:hypothetical protein K466DRAFT_554219 [Polyporus arcularius HHB13444]|uniref:Uncharacterized protein n=1 Tax=Polyporus arcularius HHB13444 TaxID=1314778 RepID=A0A5C3P2U9_9APHY|nr:hypothetical protein K466DRAFT_554219 [Polyporus arcularius HHB13444]
MSTRQARLPQNWQTEFNTTVVRPPGPEHRATVQYTCKACPSSPVFGTTASAKRHAQGQEHRRRVHVPTTPVLTRAVHELSTMAGGGTQAVDTESPDRRALNIASLDIPGDVEGVSSTSDSDEDTLSVAQVQWSEVHNAQQLPDTWLESGGPSNDTTGGAYMETEARAEAHGSEADLSDGETGLDLPDSGSEWDNYGSDSSAAEEPDSSSEATSEDSDTSGEFFHSQRSGQDRASTSSRNGPWAPYPNATYAILDSITNFPRHPISDDLLQIILWGLRQLGVKEVPTLQAFRKFQAFLRESESFAKSRAYISVLGNHFTSNDILQSARLDMSNMLVRQHLAFYPERSREGVSELRHSLKWLSTLPDCHLTPMWASPSGAHFYVGELAQQTDGSYVILLRWFLWDGVMHMVYYPVYDTESGLEVDPSMRLEGCADRLQTSLPDLLCAEAGLRIAVDFG